MSEKTPLSRVFSTFAMLAMLAALMVAVPALTNAQTAPDRRVANTADPVQASIDVSTAFFTASDARVKSVVLGRSDVFADNLGGSSLAGALGTGPLLLNPTATLDTRIATEIQRVLGSPRPCAPAGEQGQVILLGGTAAISQAVQKSLSDPPPAGLGYCTVRLAGAGRVETSVEIGKLFAPQLTSPRTIFLARDNNPADSAAAGGLAARNGVPILVNPVATLHPAIEAFITQFQIANVVLLGGPAALSDDVASRLNTLGVTVSRFQGASRDDTSQVIARQFTNPTPTTVGIVNGFNADGWTYALTAGAIGGRENIPLVYVNTPNPQGSPTGVGVPVGTYLCDTFPTEIVSFGPIAAIPSSVSDAARTQANCGGATPTPTPTPTPAACTPFDPVPPTISVEDFTVPPGPSAENRTLVFHAGDTVTITASSNNNQDPFLLLEDPSGNTIATNDDIAPGDVTAQIIVQIRQTGPHLIETTDFNGQANDITLVVESAPGPGATQIANEIRTIAPNATQDFVLPFARTERIRVNVLNLAGVDPIAEVFDPFGGSLGIDDDSGFLLEPLFSTPVFDDGNHTISVSDFDNQGGCVQVVIHVYPQLPLTSSFLDLTLPANGNIPITDFVDLTPTERVIFNAIAAGNADPTVELFDSNGTSLGFDDDGGGGLDSLLDLILFSDGLHRVEFGNLAGTPEPAFLSMDLFHRVGAFNVINESLTLSGGTVTTRTVDLRAGETFILDTTALDPNVTDPIVEIFDPNGTPVDSDDDNGFFVDSRNFMLANQTGTYRIEVRNLNGAGGGVTLNGTVL